MSDRSKKEREERALDALLVTTLRKVEKDDELIEVEKLPELAEKERAAMAGLGSDFIARILAGQPPLTPQTATEVQCPDEGEEDALAGCGADHSFNRAEEVDDATLEELDEQERAALKRKAERERGPDGDKPAP